MDLVSLQAIYHYKIAQSFSGEASYAQISGTCGLDEPTLRRIMRHAMTNHIFKEHNNIVSHTAASKLLNENPLLQAWVGMICEESWPAAARVRQPNVFQTIEYPLTIWQTVDALARWPESQEPEHTVKLNWSHGQDRVG